MTSTSMDTNGHLDTARTQARIDDLTQDGPEEIWADEGDDVGELGASWTGHCDANVLEVCGGSARPVPEGLVASLPSDNFKLDNGKRSDSGSVRRVELTKQYFAKIEESPFEGVAIMSHPDAGLDRTKPLIPWIAGIGHNTEDSAFWSMEFEDGSTLLDNFDVAVVLVDFDKDLGQSARETADAIEAYRKARGDAPHTPLMVMGHSGGAAVGTGAFTELVNRGSINPDGSKLLRMDPPNRGADVAGVLGAVDKVVPGLMPKMGFSDGKQGFANQIENFIGGIAEAQAPNGAAVVESFALEGPEVDTFNPPKLFGTIPLATNIDAVGSLQELPKREYKKILHWLQDNVGTDVDFSGLRYFRGPFIRVRGLENQIRMLHKYHPETFAALQQTALKGGRGKKAAEEFKKAFKAQLSEDIQFFAGEHTGYLFTDPCRDWVKGELADFGQGLKQA